MDVQRVPTWIQNPSSASKSGPGASFGRASNKKHAKIKFVQSLQALQRHRFSSFFESRTGLRASAPGGSKTTCKGRPLLYENNRKITSRVPRIDPRMVSKSIENCLVSGPELPSSNLWFPGCLQKRTQVDPKIQPS